MAEEWRLCDLFCGGGLLAKGFADVGFTVSMGVDKDPMALRTFKANNPRASIKCTTLGAGHEFADWPAPSERLHVHLSPECTEISSAKGAKGDVKSGIGLLEWSIEQAIERKYRSWSVETVVSRHTRACLESVQKKCGDKLGYTQIDAADLGCPQSRLRYIVAPPWLIQRLIEYPSPPRRSVSQAFEAQGLRVPSSHVTNTNASTATGSNVRSANDVAFTICASRALTFCDVNRNTVRSMTPEDSRVLMGLPSTWKFAPGATQRNRQHILGNGIAYQLSRAIAQCAKGTAAEAQAAAAAAVSQEANQQDSLLRQLKRVRKRLRALEEAQGIIIKRVRE